jgi:predicted nucleotidyltransferase
MIRTEYINGIKNVLKSTSPNAEVLLYGSQVRGDTRQDSDIDLLILLDRDNISYSERVKITEPLYQLELNDDYVVSISPLVNDKKTN